MICHRCRFRASAALPSSSQLTFQSSASWSASASALEAGAASNRYTLSSRRPSQGTLSFSTVTKPYSRRLAYNQPCLSRPFSSSSANHEASPPATSRAAAESSSTASATLPLSDGEIPSSAKAEQSIATSSVPAGASLKGLNYLRNKNDPVALEDDEYPPWLWTCLSSTAGKGATDGSGGAAAGEEGDIYSKSKKQRRAAAKKLRKANALDPDHALRAPPVPLEEQSIDLPSNAAKTVEGALEALGSREALTAAMRKKRRGSIKEANFLKGMR